MKKFTKWFLAGLMALSMTACSSSETAETSGSLFTAGTYEAEADGFAGSSSPVHVKVTFTEDAIESIEYTADGETPTVGGAALPLLVENVLAAQSTQIDGVSGATLTSNGFFEAVNDTITQAGADPEKLEPKENTASAEDIEETYDVVVVGAGGAGMTAAITAAQNGKSVMIIEKASVAGGNSSRDGWYERCRNTLSG